MTGSVVITDADLKESGARLLELAKALDAPFRRVARSQACVAFAQRSRSLFTGIEDCIAGRAPIVIHTLLRSLVEANITLRFILQADSDLRWRLWRAEDTRIRLAMDSEIQDIARKSGLLPLFDFVPAAIKPEYREEIKEVRAQALRRGVPGVREERDLFPSMWEQVDALNEFRLRLTYTFAYRQLSGHVHVGASAFSQAKVTKHGDLISFRDEPGDLNVAVSRVTAVTTFASTLTIASEEMALGIGDEADDIMRRFRPDELPLAERRLLHGQ